MNLTESGTCLLKQAVARRLKQALEIFSGRLLVKIVKTLNDRQSALLAELLRSFLDKSGKGKEERGKRKEERGRGILKKVPRVTKHGFVF